jgi:DNA mismatch endonuclease, patch repair protein
LDAICDSFGIRNLLIDLMADVLTPEQRSRCMSAIRAKNTIPEMRLRCELHGLGYRYKLHDRSLPGKPDLVFPARRAVIFVHGCFWHRHACKAGRSLPATRAAFWLQKLLRNRERDQANLRRLRELGWRVLVVWECQISKREIRQALNKLAAFLDLSCSSRNRV